MNILPGVLAGMLRVTRDDFTAAAEACPITYAQADEA